MGNARHGLSIALCGSLLAIAGLTGTAPASPVPEPPELWVMDADGTGQRRVAADIAGIYPADGAWSPDSTRLVVDGLHVVDVTTGEATSLTSGRGPDWDPTGETIAFSDVTSNETTYDEELYLIDADGTDRRLLVDTERLDSSPEWSPDGSAIAFVSGEGSGAPGQIYVVRRDGTGLARVTTAGSLYVAPEWSPDGTQLVFETFDYRLYVVNADGSGERPLTGFAYSTDPTWCADGTLYFSGAPTSPGPVAIYRLSRSGIPERVVDGTQPDCSPLGRLAFVRDGDVHVLDPDEQGTPNLTASDDRSDFRPLWSPDGRSIAFTSQPNRPRATQVERTVTINLRRHLVVRGQVTPHVNCLEPLKVQRLRSSGWKTLETVYPGSDGAFRARVADRPGFYRVVAPHSFSDFGEHECLRDASRIVRHRH